MNEKEALEIVKCTNFCGGCTAGLCNECENKIAKDVTVASLEKQVAKKPVKADVQPYIRKKFANEYTCPVCHRKVERRWNGCPYCLQRLEWEG